MAMKRRENGADRLLRWIGAALLAAMIALMVLALVSVGRDSGEDGLRQLETGVRRSVMACYASEGVYPPDLEYLKEHYGLQVDEERYAVHYICVAENLMPDITVQER